jgi:hypothetical protein
MKAAQKTVGDMLGDLASPSGGIARLGRGQALAPDRPRAARSVQAWLSETLDMLFQACGLRVMATRQATGA